MLPGSLGSRGDRGEHAQQSNDLEPGIDVGGNGAKHRPRRDRDVVEQTFELGDAGARWRACRQDGNRRVPALNANRATPSRPMRSSASRRLEDETDPGGELGGRAGACGRLGEPQAGRMVRRVLAAERLAASSGGAPASCERQVARWVRGPALVRAGAGMRWRVRLAPLMCEQRWMESSLRRSRVSAGCGVCDAVWLRAGYCSWWCRGAGIQRW